MTDRHGVSEEDVAHYTCLRNAGNPRTARTERAEEPVWQKAPRSPRFVDMVTGEPGYFDTRAAALWDDENSTSRSGQRKPFPEAHMTGARTGIVFAENDRDLHRRRRTAHYEFRTQRRESPCMR